MKTYWHVYKYTGRAHTDGQVRRGEAPAKYPRFELKTWLTRPVEHISNTFTEIDPAVDWLRGNLTSMEPVDAAAFPIEDRLVYSRSTLGQTVGNDVVYGYYTKTRTYVSRALIACPRRKMSPLETSVPSCPQPPG